MEILTTGKLQVYLASGNAGSGTTVLAASTWYRLETQMTYGTSATLTYRLYNSSGTLLETVSSGAASSLNTSAAVWFGCTAAFTGTLWFDEPAVSDQGWIGTATGSSIGPVAKQNNAGGGTNGVTVTAANSGGASGDAFDVSGGPPHTARRCCGPAAAGSISTAARACI